MIISTERRKRPNDFRIERVPRVGPASCPFCPGREDLTPPEVMAYRENGSRANAPGWSVRVVPNKFPALQVEGTLDRSADGMLDRMNGIGAHEVIIETPDHDKSMATMSEGEIERVLLAYRDRILDLRQDRRFRHILVFKNHGAGAGATLEHEHSQLIAMPLVPDYVREEVDGAARHFADKERCIFCDIVRQELEERRRIVTENSDIVVLEPYAPRVPFETWLLPRRHAARLEEAPRHEFENLARVLKWVIVRMERALESPPYNLVFHTAPFVGDVEASYHWHVEVLPKLTRVAGFEWGTGFSINPTSPEEAARVLRETVVPA